MIGIYFIFYFLYSKLHRKADSDYASKKIDMQIENMKILSGLYFREYVKKCIARGVKP